MPQNLIFLKNKHFDFCKLPKNFPKEGTKKIAILFILESLIWHQKQQYKQNLINLNCVYGYFCYYV